MITKKDMVEVNANKKMIHKTIACLVLGFILGRIKR